MRPIPPYSVWFLATALAKSGYNPTIVDERLCEGGEGFLQRIREAVSKQPLFIGFSCSMAPQLSLVESFLPFSNYFEYSGPWVLGGAFVSHLPPENIRDRLLGKAGFQILCHGHGFETILDICEAIEGRRKPSNILGISYLTSKGDVVTTGPRGFPTCLPVPDYDLINVEKYVHDEDIYRGRPVRTFNLYTSTGCMSGCEFCINSIERKWVGQSSEEVLCQIEYLHSRFGVEYIRLIDDSPLQQPERILELYRALDREGLNIKFYMDVTVPHILSSWFEEIATRLIKVYVGVESGSERILKLIGKPQSISDIKRAVENLNRKGIAAKYSLMKNLPDEKEEDRRATESLVEWIKANHSNCAISLKDWLPVYGTPLYRRYHKQMTETQRRILGSGETVESDAWTAPEYREM